MRRMNTNNFSNNLRKARLDIGWSQTDLSEASGFTQSQVSDFETGRRTPCLENLYRLREALGSTWDALLGKPKKGK